MMLALCTKISYRPLDIDQLKRMIITPKPRLFPLGFEWWQSLPFPSSSNRRPLQDLIEDWKMWNGARQQQQQQPLSSRAVGMNGGVNQIIGIYTNRYAYRLKNECRYAYYDLNNHKTPHRSAACPKVSYINRFWKQLFLPYHGNWLSSSS